MKCVCLNKIKCKTQKKIMQMIFDLFEFKLKKKVKYLKYKA